MRLTEDRLIEIIVDEISTIMGYMAPLCHDDAIDKKRKDVLTRIGYRYEGDDDFPYDKDERRYNRVVGTNEKVGKPVSDKVVRRNLATGFEPSRK